MAGLWVPTSGSKDSVLGTSFARTGVFPESQGIPRDNQILVKKELAIQESFGWTPSIRS